MDTKNLHRIIDRVYKTLRLPAELERSEHKTLNFNRNLKFTRKCFINETCHKNRLQSKREIFEHEMALVRKGKRVRINGKFYSSELKELNCHSPASSIVDSPWKWIQLDSKFLRVIKEIKGKIDPDGKENEKASHEYLQSARSSLKNFEFISPQKILKKRIVIKSVII